MFVNSLTRTLPASEQRLEMYRQAQEWDEVCTQLREYCKMGWPRKQLIPLSLTPYWKARNSLTICNDLLLYNSRIVVPKSLQRETLQKIHSGHLGIEKCKKRTANIGMVAGSDAPDHSTCAELQSMRQREQTRKGTVDDVRIAEVSLAGRGYRSF